MEEAGAVRTQVVTRVLAIVSSALPTVEASGAESLVAAKQPLGDPTCARVTEEAKDVRCAI